MGLNNNIKDFIRNLKNDGYFDSFKHVLELGSQDDFRNNVAFNKKFIPSLESAGCRDLGLL